MCALNVATPINLVGANTVFNALVHTLHNVIWDGDWSGIFSSCEA